MKLSVGVLVCILALLVIPRPVHASGLRSDKTQTPQPSAERVMFADSTGRQVEVPSKITKISASGSLAQTFLLAIAPDLLCTITAPFPQSEAEFLPEYVLKLPVVGQFYGAANLNLEEIAAIGPELVIDIGEPKNTASEDMEGITKAVGIPALHITGTLNSTADAFRTLGRLLGRQEKGEALARYCEKNLEIIDQIMAQVGDNKKSVLYCLGKQGQNVLAFGSFHAEVVDRLADNQAVVANPTSRGTGNETNMEQLLLWDPEVILFGYDSVFGTVGTDPAWRQMRAIRNGAYFEVPLGPYNWMGAPPSINRYLGMLWMVKLLYPEYAQFDLYTEAAEYYRLFYSHDLSQERFNALIANSIGRSGL
ncbi:MAG: ABC transporter substrate-binding protein [Treponema sp.]|nr:ABC transporter substrate-binding protein [Treponema sp.]